MARVSDGKRGPWGGARGEINSGPSGPAALLSPPPWIAIAVVPSASGLTRGRRIGSRRLTAMFRFTLLRATQEMRDA
jgi:hypothetical protein